VLAAFLGVVLFAMFVLTVAVIIVGIID